MRDARAAPRLAPVTPCDPLIIHRQEIGDELIALVSVSPPPRKNASQATNRATQANEWRKH